MDPKTYLLLLIISAIIALTHLAQRRDRIGPSDTDTSAEA
jgi:hypothetical protein